MPLNIDSPHMDRGGQLLKEYVQNCISGTPFETAREPVAGLHDREEEGYGTTAFRVYATDEAISFLGGRGPAALEMLGAGLREAAASSRSVFALIAAIQGEKLSLEMRAS